MMRRLERNPFLLRALVACFGLALASKLPSQTFTTRHSFAAGTDGGNPAAGLVLSGTTLYGTTRVGGNQSHGTVFSLNTDGTGFTNLHNFSATTYSIGIGAEVNNDGTYPYAGLILSGRTLYGTASQGGGWGVGTVFAVDTGSKAFRTVYSLSGYPTDASTPFAGVVALGSSLYGTTHQGGSLDLGSAFKVNTNGTGATTLYNFTGLDGCHLTAGLVSSGTTLYGTAREGGSMIYGTVFRISNDGSGFMTLHNFTGLTSSNNIEGAYPVAGLTILSNTLYGTTEFGGVSAHGTLFKLNTDGTGFSTLHHFTAFPGSGAQTNSDGANPRAELMLSGTTLYGTTRLGGAYGFGTVFQMNLDGTGFATLHSFAGGNTEGANPRAGLILSSNTLFGTTETGGSTGQGTVFSLSLANANLPQPAIACSGTNIVLTWPTNLAGLTLQSATDLGLPAVWTTVSPDPVIVNDQNVVTNPIAGTQRFYRLSQ